MEYLNGYSQMEYLNGYSWTDNLDTIKSCNYLLFYEEKKVTHRQTDKQ